MPLERQTGTRWIQRGADHMLPHLPLEVVEAVWQPLFSDAALGVVQARIDEWDDTARRHGLGV